MSLPGKALGAQVIWVLHPDAVGFLGETDAIIEGKGETQSSLEGFDECNYGS